MTITSALPQVQIARYWRCRGSQRAGRFQAVIRSSAHLYGEDIAAAYEFATKAEARRWADAWLAEHGLRAAA